MLERHRADHGPVCQEEASSFVLGRSDPSYLAKLVDDEKFIDEAIAAQLGCSGVESQREHASLGTVDEASEESFPASDPPARSVISAIAPPHRDKPAA
jgi:hypothetical protein